MAKQQDPTVKETVVIEPWRVFTLQHVQKAEFTVAQLQRLIAANEIPDDATISVGRRPYSYGLDENPYYLTIEWKRPANG